MAVKMPAETSQRRGFQSSPTTAATPIIAASTDRVGIMPVV